MKNNTLAHLRILAIMEGISYLLFGITMPIKYIYDIKEPNYFIGMAHGVLFLLYCLYVLIVANQRKWELKKTFVCLIASLLPIATFVIDAKILKKEAK